MNHKNIMLVLVEFYRTVNAHKDSPLVLVKDYYIDWNNREAVRRFAAEANDWLRDEKGNKVSTSSM